MTRALCQLIGVATIPVCCSKCFCFGKKKKTTTWQRQSVGFSYCLSCAVWPCLSLLLLSFLPFGIFVSRWLVITLMLTLTLNKQTTPMQRSPLSNVSKWCRLSSHFASSSKYHGDQGSLCVAVRGDKGTESNPDGKQMASLFFFFIIFYCIVGLSITRTSGNRFALV